jgi:hypothetical protein
MTSRNVSLCGVASSEANKMYFAEMAWYSWRVIWRSMVLREILQNKYITNIQHSASKAAGHVFFLLLLCLGDHYQRHLYCLSCGCSFGSVLCHFTHRGVHNDCQVRLGAGFMDVTRRSTRSNYIWGIVRYGWNFGSSCPTLSSYFEHRSVTVMDEAVIRPCHSSGS